jgi:signal transduction histidine kinase
MPAALAGGLAVGYVYETQKQQDLLVTAARNVEANLNSGQWKISPSTYTALSGELRRILGEGKKPAVSRAALAEGVEWLWERSSSGRGSLAPGRQNLTTPSGSVLLLWKSSGNVVAGFAAGPKYLESEWLAELKPSLESLHVQLVLTDLEGHAVFGKPPDGAGRPAIKLVPETGLPWTIQVFSTGNADEFSSGRNLLIAGMAVLLVLILTGTWFIGHAVSRELAVARLQTDFVSTVSHEFRTPLTTLCQLSELLKRERVASAKDRREYYELLYTESHRLRRLVEALLNFGRLEAGRLQFHFEEIDAAAFLRQSAAEFVEAQQTFGHRLEIDTPAAPRVHADRETLRCVFWNLFENAVKYSPGCDTVWLSLSRRGPHVEIEVRDQGVGIPSSEHRRVFEKFVRGSTAREKNISGTGIGLAMARQIVRAHGGDITLESEPGKGSTFRVVLPEMQGDA